MAVVRASTSTGHEVEFQMPEGALLRDAARRALEEVGLTFRGRMLNCEAGDEFETFRRMRSRGPHYLEFVCDRRILVDGVLHYMGRELPFEMHARWTVKDLLEKLLDYEDCMICPQFLPLRGDDEYVLTTLQGRRLRLDERLLEVNGDVEFGLVRDDSDDDSEVDEDEDEFDDYSDDVGSETSSDAPPSVAETLSEGGVEDWQDEPWEFVDCDVAQEDEEEKEEGAAMEVDDDDL